MGLAELRKYASDQKEGPPDLPLAVMVKLDKYCDPTFHDGTVQIILIHHT